MSIKIVIPPGLRVFTDDKGEIEVGGDTVGECLENLAALFPMIGKTIFFQKGELFNFGHNKVSIYLNDEDAYPDELGRPVKDGDTIHILYSISGG
jgi:molybdopterin converting factor small subunit